MEDWRISPLNRPNPEILRAHCQYFSRLGFALFAQMMSMIVVQVAAAVPVALLAPGLLADPVFLWNRFLWIEGA